MPRKTNYIRLLLTLHKYIGLFVFIVLVWLAVSGIFLNHTTALDLSHKTVKNPVISSLYGISSPKISRAVKLGEHWLIEAGDTVYFLGKKLSIADYQPLVAAIQSSELLFIVREKSLLLYTLEGEFIDSLTFPAKAEGMSLKNNKVILKTSDACFMSNESYTVLHACPQNMRVKWQGLDTLPEVEKNHFLDQYQGDGVVLEQVILDAHSGRILGNVGVIFMDAIAVLIILLSVSGVSLWGIRKYRQFKRKA